MALDHPKLTGKSPPDTGTSSPITTRSPITRGKALSVAGGDLRGPWARRMRDLMDLHLSDLGGPDNVSEAEASLVRRAAVIETELERLESRFASGEGTASDLDLYQRSAGNLRRLLEATGLRRRPRVINTEPQTVDELVAKVNAELTVDGEPVGDEEKRP
jgi:hypothetical protein